ncbi:heterokaryon incompatibility protein [Colletotrichum musicola]|uniref:Heterokaryon incompatibility protein n=1 Tax=Colletotrichum musicola TaxID=2175873 RepID=A0A8H6ND71_9PEZI|nr:heterokaryon incompatibility protein [Colletotrichum musicola]
MDEVECSCSRPDIVTAGGITSCMGCGGVPVGLRPTSPSTSSDLSSPGSTSPGPASPGATLAELPDEVVTSDPIYKALGTPTDIRLLTLEPGEFDDPVQSTLSLGNTSGRTEYEAISYTWGGEDNNMAKTGLILVNSQEFAVTPNGETALRRVRLMPQIYSRARLVLIYIGEACPEDEQLLRLLAAGDLAPDFWEVALARRALLLCGSHSIPWSSFQVPQLEARGLAQADLEALPSVVRFQAPQYRDSSDLLQLLDWARSSRATDPRDKVFAVYGLLFGAEIDGLHPDYTLSVKDVYLRIAAWIAQRFGILALLARCVGEDDTDDEELSSALKVMAKATNANLEGARDLLRLATEADLRGEELKKQFNFVVGCEADANDLEGLVMLANEGNLGDGDLRALLFPKTHQTLKLRKLPAWAPDWTFRQSTTTFPDRLIWGDFNPRRVALPVKILADSGILRVPAFKVGKLADELADSSRSRPLAYWSFGGEIGAGYGQAQFVDLTRAYGSWRLSRWTHDEVYLVPRPDEYGSFSFDEPGEVSVYVDPSSVRWIHKSPEGQTTAAGYFSEWMISGLEIGVGLFCPRGLLTIEWYNWGSRGCLEDWAFRADRDRQRRCHPWIWPP